VSLRYQEAFRHSQVIQSEFAVFRVQISNTNVYRQSVCRLSHKFELKATDFRFVTVFQNLKAINYVNKLLILINVKEVGSVKLQPVVILGIFKINFPSIYKLWIHDRKLSWRNYRAGIKRAAEIPVLKLSAKS